MPPVTIYTKAFCPYCSAAKDLLNEKSVAFTEIPVKSAAEQMAMAQKAGAVRPCRRSGSATGMSAAATTSMRSMTRASWTSSSRPETAP